MIIQMKNILYKIEDWIWYIFWHRIKCWLDSTEIENLKEKVKKYIKSKSI